MVRVGVHVSIAGSISLSVDRAVAAGCDTFQIFSRNPRGWQYKELTDEDCRRFRERLAMSGIGPVVDHMPYLPNLAAPGEDMYQKSISTLTIELGRCEALGIPYLVTHLGHHLGAGKDSGIRRVVEAITRAFAASPGRTMLLLENTAGEKNSVGSTFEDIRTIIDQIPDKRRIGVCFDTCHAFAAGYDLRTPEGVTATLDALDSTIGLDRIRVVHCNDAKGDLGSHLDRHEHIGLGSIGEEGFRQILRHPAIRQVPLLCETPDDPRRDDAGNIAKLRELAG